MKMTELEDEKWMRLALSEAQKGWGLCNPNPMVGAAIVRDGALLGLASASHAKKEGKSIDQIVDAADGIVEDKPGSLSAGSDTGLIIDKDRQEYSGGEWKWK